MNEHPGKQIRNFLDAKGWTQDDLAAVTGYSRQTVNGLIAGRNRVTPDMAVALAAALGSTAAEWLRWDAEHQLSLVQVATDDVGRRARLYELAPISDMQKRGWIGNPSDTDALVKEVDDFFGGSVEAGVSFPIAARQSNPLDGFSPADKAWCFRAKQLAAQLLVAEFSEERVPAIAKKLRQLAAQPKEITRLADMLSYFGVRFVIVEPLPGARMDGAAFWVGGNPVIAVSGRFDRIDAFWFVVFHELGHIVHGDVFSADVDLVQGDEKGGITISAASNEAEDRANFYAQDNLVPNDEMESFISRLSPLFSETAIVQFANRIRMHPGVIVGQLQRRKQIRYSAHRSFLVKVRSLVTATALTDGWGQGAPAIT